MAADALSGRLENAAPKSRAASIRVRIAEIESFFLNNYDDRAPAAEDRWMDYAEMSLKGPVSELRDFERTAAKYGDGMIMI